MAVTSNEIAQQNFSALVIDDEPQVREFVATVLRQTGWAVSQSPSAEDAICRMDEEAWSVVFCDVILGGADGYSVLRQFKEKRPATKFVLMTGHGSAAGAFEATAYGACDYLLKPFDLEELHSLSLLLREQVSERSRRPSGRRSIAYRSDINVVGASPLFIDVMKHVGRVAPTKLPVLLAGESGTGKELVASAIHQGSLRAEQPFVAVNCGAIAAELIESELFGHVKGSFTGADRDRAGLWEEADGGTVFLDEITETSLSFQVKLLRLLQEGEVRRVGSNQTQRVDVRVIAASNRDVENEVAAGRFREDLFYRLNAVSIKLPSLRERTDDIPSLAQAFAERVYTKGAGVRISDEALDILKRHSWPGNIRELENAVIHAATICDGIIRVRDLPQSVRKQEANGSLAREVSEPLAVALGMDEWPSLAEVEGRYLARVLEHTRGNKQAAARVMLVDRKTLDRMIKRHRIQVKRDVKAR